jgi:hypothetical protein
MSQTFAAPPIPASFDFRGAFASSLISFYNPIDPTTPRVIAGWARLISSFSAAMSTNNDQPGDWTDQGFSENWLAVRAYDDWRWSPGGPRVPVYLEVPYGFGKLHITVPNVNYPANYYQTVFQDLQSQGYG